MNTDHITAALMKVQRRSEPDLAAQHSDLQLSRQGEGTGDIEDREQETWDREQETGDRGQGTGIRASTEPSHNKEARGVSLQSSLAMWRVSVGSERCHFPHVLDSEWELMA
ncbi:hypothetical protein EYF80_008860 [Liparis tanakae]|uniref:Uncharacterized protein n=1 Tax=Liparis tanakae TaxID=230148 RepID=A0A4Z2ISI2_9TELE|nr:hypothetical protein EYF80_008860 [Liparis tanakae]